MICDARFSKCCGGITERYSTAWEDQEIRYLESVYDGPEQTRAHIPETWIRSDPPAYCNTRDSELLSRILPGFDRETRDFYRWRVEYSPDELADLVKSRVGVDLGPIRDIEALARGPSGRIYRLKLSGERDYLFIGKELEIRRALSRTSLIRNRGASSCAAPDGGMASGCARSVRQSWPMRAGPTKKFCSITIAEQQSAPDVCGESQGFQAADDVPADVHLPPMPAEAGGCGPVVMIPVPVLTPRCHLQRSEPPDVLA